jgi:hypothetical protein
MTKLSAESKNVLDSIKTYSPVRSSQLENLLGVSSKTIYKHLSRLLDECEIIKTGSTPLVFYSPAKTFPETLMVNDSDDYLIEKNYIFVSPSGVIFKGINGFQIWCNKNKFDFEDQKQKLVKRIKEVEKLKIDGLISAKQIILSGKKDLYLDELYFSDFYTADHFGKTKLGQLVYLGKGSQSKEVIKEVANLIKKPLNLLINKYDIKHVFFIPPTVQRKIQFLQALKGYLKLDLKEANVMKTPGVNVPQKTIKKLEDRIENARNTIAVDPTQELKGNILIIDDATGSGATLNETAKKIRKLVGPRIKIIGYSVVGSSKGFDVISEV